MEEKRILVIEYAGMYGILNEPWPDGRHYSQYYRKKK